MKISYFGLDLETPDCMVGREHDLFASYLEYPINKWVKSLKLELGACNRLVFTEGGGHDFWILGENALNICLKEEYGEVRASLTSPELIHAYFSRKMLEGFAKLDERYHLDLAAQCTSVIAQLFQDGLTYREVLKTKRVRGYQVEVFQTYTCYQYELWLRITQKGVLIGEQLIHQAKPDSYLIRMDVKKVVIDESAITIIDNIGGVFRTVSLEGLIPVELA